MKLLNKCLAKTKKRKRKIKMMLKNKHHFFYVNILLNAKTTKQDIYLQINLQIMF